MSASLYQRVTDTILAQLSTADPASWTCPWHRAGGGLPRNALTGRRYRGINILSCWAAAQQADYADNRWASYNQWAELGGRVRRGEKGTVCVFFKTLPMRGDGRASSGAKPNGEHGADDRAFVLRYSTIFNAEQIDGAPPAPDTSPVPPAALDPTPVFDRFVASTGAIITPGENAAYVPALDTIRMPARERFLSTEGYTATLAHELLHWSGAPHRLDRQLSTRFGTHAYAAEELIAELGAAFVLASLDLAPTPHPNHAAYIASWLPLVQRDPRALFTAAAHASRAADFLNPAQPSSPEAEQQPADAAEQTAPTLSRATD